jgi:hypothetical protein
LCHHPLDPPEQLEPTKWWEWNLQLRGPQPLQESGSKQKVPFRQLPAQQPAVKWKPQVAGAQRAMNRTRDKTYFPQDSRHDKKDRSPYSGRLPDWRLRPVNRRTLNRTDFLLDYPHHKRDILIMPGWT